MVPPDPGLMQRLLLRFRQLKNEKRLRLKDGFDEYFSSWLAERRGEDVPGLDDGTVDSRGIDPNLQLIERPTKKLAGTIHAVVLLVDFEDCPSLSENTAAVYQEMLFGELPSGSMRSYYNEISCWDASTGNGVDVNGTVHGWYRMPHDLKFYTNGVSGTSENAFPRNAQGLAKDAVQAAIDDGVDFAGSDAFGEGIVTALIIIHAGRGAEQTGSKSDLWSLKWEIPDGGTEVDPSTRLTARTFLTVPEDCRVGVCAHELGHLAARWADFYDTGKVSKSKGLGDYCLMASGSWGDGGLRPTLPNGMLRMFHDWIPVKVLTDSEKNIALSPAATADGMVVVIRNESVMSPTQYVLVEFRKRVGFDQFLPDEGIAVYVIDEQIVNVNNESALAIELIQADGKQDLSKILFGNAGDSSDLFPATVNGKVRRTLGKTNSRIELPDGQWSGVTIKVKGDPSDDQMFIDVEVHKLEVA
ncbi:M6 family metalloprotease domain-containing protein [Rubripirellula amarantea]|nr:M6 family metalloprotease domain-containing protein [Rubripirellula amarantea]